MALCGFPGWQAATPSLLEVGGEELGIFTFILLACLAKTGRSGLLYLSHQETLAQVSVPPEQAAPFMGLKYFVLTLGSWLGAATWQLQFFPPALLRALSTKEEVRSSPNRVWSTKGRICLPAVCHSPLPLSTSDHENKMECHVGICPYCGWGWGHKKQYKEKGFGGFINSPLYMLFSLHAQIFWERGFLKTRKNHINP